MGNQDKYQQIFAANLRSQLEIHGKKQQDLINTFGFSSGSVSSWCSGSRIPRMDKIQLLADYFGVKPSYLLGDDEAAHDVQYVKRQTLAAKISDATPEELDKIDAIINIVMT